MRYTIWQQSETFQQVVYLTLEAIMKHQVEHLNKIGVAATAIDIEEEAGKNGRVQDCV